MQNGTGLSGDPSSTQSAIIVPQPGNDSVYFLFTIDSETGARGLCYSIVNMNHNGGLGEVIIKNVSILANANEKLTAVRHSNNKDIWVITRQFNSNKYLAWLVSSSGVSPLPIISLSTNQLGAPIGISRGYLKASPNGRKLVSAFEENPFFEVSDFDPSTGIVSNILNISSHPPSILFHGRSGTYGVEFSPNNLLLYLTGRVDTMCGTCQSYNYFLNQFDISSHNPSVILNSAVLIDSGGTVNNPMFLEYGALQLAKNGKIYISVFQEKKLAVINDPDVKGINCNYQPGAVYLGIGRAAIGLPAFIQSYFDPGFRKYDFGYSEDCNKNVSFQINSTFPYDSIKWNFDDPFSGTNNTSIISNPVHGYNNSGIKNIQLLVFNQYDCINRIDTITKEVAVGNRSFNLGKDTSICDGDSISLSAGVAGALHYSWNTGAITPTIRVSNAGLYWCDVDFGECLYRDSIFIANKPYPNVYLGSDTTLCDNNPLILKAGNRSANYLWQDGSTLSTYYVHQNGVYHVRVNLAGCISSDTINIRYDVKPAFTLGPDKKMCNGIKLTLQPTIFSNTAEQDLNYLWENGSHNTSVIVDHPGKYSLWLKNFCGLTYDEINITQGICGIYIPSGFTPNADNINDIFKVEYGDNVNQFHFQIFNRYGETVFESADINKGWDGTFKNRRQPQGTYTWVIQYRSTQSHEKQILTGTVLLLW